MDQGRFHVRKLSAEDLEQYNELLRYAFQVTERTLLESGWEDEEIKQSKFPVLERANVWGCFDGENLVSQFAAYPLEMNLHGRIYPIAFVTSVSTYPEYSGMGLMSELMGRSLAEMREEGQSLSLLYPYSIPLYRKKGWEIVSDKMSFQIPDVQLPRGGQSPGQVRRVEWDDPDFIGLHARFARQTHGCLLRNNLAWDEYWRWDEDDTTVAVYYGADGRPRGYMVYLIKEDTMYIKEMIYLDQEGRKGLWSYIGAHESMVSEVRGSHYFSQPIAFSLEDSDIKETIRPYIMGRIVDVEPFLRGYRFASGVRGTLTLDLTDPVLPWNQRSVTLALDGGGAALVEGPAPGRAALSIGTLTTLLLGYRRASELYDLGRIETDAATLELLDRAVIARKPYISDYI